MIYAWIRRTDYTRVDTACHDEVVFGEVASDNNEDIATVHYFRPSHLDKPTGTRPGSNTVTLK